MRVTSDVTSTVSTKIVTNANATAATIPATDPGGTTPEREGLVTTARFPPPLTTTRCRVGLQASCTRVGAMLNPVIARPLTKGVGKSKSKKTQQQKIKKKQRKTYQEVSGTTLKERPDVNRPTGQGPLPGYDPCPLTSVGGGVVPTGSCPAYGSP